MSSGQHERLKALMLADPWIYAHIICKTGEGFVERFHRPLLYWLTGDPDLLIVSLQRYKSLVSDQINAELRRLGALRDGIYDPVRVKRALRRTNTRIARSMGKSTAGMTAIHCVATRDPNMTIGIASKAEPAAVAFLDQLARWTLSDEYKFFFPERIPPKNIDDYIMKNSIWLWGRTNISPESTIEARGVNGQWTGHHYNWLYPDDIIGTESGDASVDDAHRWLANVTGISINPALGGTRETYVGTIYGPDDDHSVISSDWHTASIIVPIWEKQRYTISEINLDGTPVLPEWYEKPKIVEMRESIKNNKKFGPIWWLQNFEMAAHLEGASMFTRSMIERQRFVWHISHGRKYIARPKAGIPRTDKFDPKTWLLIDPMTLTRYMAVDQAVSTATGSDEWAISVVGFDGEGHAYLLDLQTGKGYSAMLYQIPGIHRAWNPVKIGIDSNATQSMTLDWMKRDPEFQMMKGILTPVHSGNRAKEDRIRAFLAARLEMGELWTSPHLSEYEHRALNYRPGPKAKDDVLDATAMAVAIGLPGDSLTPAQIEANLDEARRARETHLDANGVLRDTWLDLI